MLPLPKVVIPSARADNLIPCVRSVLACEPSWRPSQIIVVDDGARTLAEPVLPAVRWVSGVKPFIFARNVNRGIEAAAPSDVILLNDDARLLTLNGFSRLSAIARESGIGVCSAGIRGVICNPNQVAQKRPRLRQEFAQLAFVCVYIHRQVLDKVGLLDERYDGYGFEDFDYCRRVLLTGATLAVWDGCRVDHTGKAPSTYRTRPDIGDLIAHSRELYRAKWDNIPTG